MFVGNTDNEKLYCKELQVILKDNTNQQRNCRLCIKVEWQLGSAGIPKQVLAVHLTDSSDPFFLYRMNLSEDDFQSLKQQQNILVDFAIFPQRFISLLESCLSEETKIQPKFLLMLNVQGTTFGSVTNTAQLDIVETNQFKHLTHLSLKLVAASETEIKQFSVACFKKMKDEKEQLEKHLSCVEVDLKKQISAYEVKLSNKVKEVNFLEEKLDVDLAEKEKQYNEDIRKEREKHRKLLKEASDRWEKEKRDLKQKYHMKVQELEANISGLELLKKEVEDRKCKAENTVCDLQNRLHGIQQENKHNKELLQNLKKQKNELQQELDKMKQTDRKLREEMKQIKDVISEKEHHISKIEEELQACVNHCKSLEKSLEQKDALLKQEIEEKENLSFSVCTANNIIRKLQEEVHISQEKLKKSGKIILKQEKTLLEKDNILKNLEKIVAELKSKSVIAEKQVEKQKSEIMRLNTEVQRYQTENMHKEKLISYLNRELTTCPRGRINVVNSQTVTAAQSNGECSNKVASPVINTVLQPGRTPMLDPKYLQKDTDFMPYQQTNADGKSHIPVLHSSSNKIVPQTNKANPNKVASSSAGNRKNFFTADAYYDETNAPSSNANMKPRSAAK